ncbi:MAG TPA: hypothetical protein VFH51_16765, partial [Myxococcota bacterium]|nr:hypothetical protein [Myxococcota bacterium]
AGHLLNSNPDVVRQSLDAAAGSRILVYGYHKHGLPGAVGIHLFHNALASLGNLRTLLTR